jgi:hypothetical protein
MKFRQAIRLLLPALFLVPAGWTPQGKPEEAWTPLFDGKTLDGWRNPYSWGDAEVKDGEIRLTTKKSKFFLVTEKEYADFIFEGEVKLPPRKGNSGFMFRAQVDPKKKGGNGTVFGYQAEVDTSDRAWSGGLYDEGRRTWFISPDKNDKASIKAFRDRAGDCYKQGEWNRYRIECRGSRIRISVNDVLTTDCEDDKDAKGVIGLQHHGEKGLTYAFRNLRIQVPGAEKPGK